MRYFYRMTDNSEKQTLQLFQDYEEHRDQTTQEPCKDKWIWYITNGHLQCSGMYFIGNPRFPNYLFM